MGGLLAPIAALIWKYLEPYLEKKWVEVKPKIFEFITEQFKEWMPQILKTVVVGIAQSAGQLTINTEDKITDIIPGDVDDKVIDPIVRNAWDKLQDILNLGK